MTTELKGKTEAAAHELFDHVHKMLTGDADGDSGTEKVGKLAILSEFVNFRRASSAPVWHGTQ